MIITKITHGIGNQLFQYALGRYLSLMNDTSLYFDLSYYKWTYESDTPRNFKLNNFQIDYKILNSSPLIYLSKATKLFPNRTLKPFFILEKEKNFHFVETILNTRSNFLTLDGFWQSEKYFNSVSSAIRNELVFNRTPGESFHSFKDQILNTKTPISIHIRRGDYVNHPEFSKTFGFVGLDYYERAVAELKRRFSDFRFFIFSDDKEWVENNFGRFSDNLVFVHNTGPNSDLDDMQLMSLCKHHVIANSSFSWWGAWLNPNEDKLVIAPKIWFKDQTRWNTKDLIPDSWMKL